MKLNKERLVDISLLVVSFTILFCVCISGFFSINNKVEKVTGFYNKVDKELFAMYVENDEGDYDVWNSDSFPKDGFKINLQKSICIDTNENKLENVITSANNGVIITSNKTAFCTLYFDIKPAGDLVIMIDNYVGNTDMPNSSSYVTSLSCDSGLNPIYNHQYNRLEISSVNDTLCDLTFRYDDASYGTLKSIVETNAHDYRDSAYYGSMGYRYTKGSNNYVWFNNELWRIIGSVKACLTASCGDNGEYLVKIIRDDSLGYFGYGDGDWGSNSLYTLLNNNYLGKNNGFEHNGIDPNGYYGRMIKEVYWNTGTTSSSSVKSIYTSEKTNQTIKGKIGLMNVSDYATLSASVSYYYEFAYSSKNNMLFKYIPEQTIEHNKFIGQGGAISNDSGRGHVRPVVHLDPSVYLISGSGSIIDPYMIGME